MFPFIPSLPATAIPHPTSTVIKADNISTLPPITGANVPAIGFSYPTGLHFTPSHGGNEILYPVGSKISTVWGDLHLLQQTPAILFDINRLDSSNAFSLWRDWELATALLPEIDLCATEGKYRLQDIAPCVGNISSYNLSRHAMRFSADRDGCYRLDFTQAIRLIRFYLDNGHKRFTRDELELKARTKLKALASRL
jgi:hypothetical protein